jgi:hypothetical protein
MNLSSQKSLIIMSDMFLEFCNALCLLYAAAFGKLDISVGIAGTAFFLDKQRRGKIDAAHIKVKTRRYE